MSTPTSGLESGEDLDNIPLVRLADVQPSRVSTCVDNPAEAEENSTVHFEYVETVSPNEDSNGGSISLHSEVVDTDDDSGSGEVIVPEYIPDELPMVSLDHRGHYIQRIILLCLDSIIIRSETFI